MRPTTPESGTPPKDSANLPGFNHLIGGHSLGANMDEPLAAEGVRFLTDSPSEPFLLVASFMNPHDVCHWIRGHEGSRAYESTAAFPPAPGNLWRDPEEPEYMQYHRDANYNRMSNSLHISKEWKADDFRHYVHDYYRLVEDVDRQIGRVLSALRFRGSGRQHRGRADIRPRRRSRRTPLDPKGGVLGGDSPCAAHRGGKRCQAQRRC